MNVNDLWEFRGKRRQVYNKPSKYDSVRRVLQGLSDSIYNRLVDVCVGDEVEALANLVPVLDTQQQLMLCYRLYHEDDADLRCLSITIAASAMQYDECSIDDVRFYITEGLTDVDIAVRDTALQAVWEVHDTDILERVHWMTKNDDCEGLRQDALQVYNDIMAGKNLPST